MLAQYFLDSFIVDGGEGQGTGDVNTVTGTIGQPDAGMTSSGNYTLSGGFSGIVAATQTEGVPWLSLKRSNNTVVVSGPLPATDWFLHATTNLVTGGGVWTEISPSCETNGPNLKLTAPLPKGKKFYRLHRP